MQEKSQGLRAAAETLRARSEALIAAAMVKEDASDEERAVSRGRATGAAGLLRPRVLVAYGCMH